MQLIVINARRNAKTFSGVRRFTRLLALAPYIAVEEILRGRRAQTRLGTLLDTVLDGSAEALQTKEAVARTKQAAA